MRTRVVAATAVLVLAYAGMMGTVAVRHAMRPTRRSVPTPELDRIYRTVPEITRAMREAGDELGRYAEACAAVMCWHEREAMRLATR